MDVFGRKLTSSFSSSINANAERDEIRYLRTLQILIHHREIEKMKDMQQKKSAGSFFPSWFTNLWKIGNMYTLNRYILIDM